MTGRSSSLTRREALRGGLDRLVTVAEEAVVAPPDEPEAPPDPLDAYFGSFEMCHTLLAEIRPLIAEEVARLGIDPRGRDMRDLAHEIFSRQERPPAPRRDADPPPASPSPVGEMKGDASAD